MSSGKLELNRNAIFPEIILINKEINLNDDYELIQNKNLIMVKKIHNLLQDSVDLTLKEKFAHCKSQRAFMKLYLNGISSKILLKNHIVEEKNRKSYVFNF